MADHKIYATTELVPLLAERGIVLSASQVHRLVTTTPERLSLPVLAALCDIFEVTPTELIPTDATNVRVRKIAAGDRPAKPTGIGDLRPVRPDRPPRRVTAADPASGVTRCARCDRRVRDRREHPEVTDEVVLVWIRRWPDGLICSGCFAQAMETYGICDGCDTDRLLPGIGPDGQHWCTDCAGGLGDFTCTRCGREGWREHAGICGWCVLQDRVDKILDDGTGRVRLELIPWRR